MEKVDKIQWNVGTIFIVNGVVYTEKMIWKIKVGVAWSSKTV